MNCTFYSLRLLQRNTYRRPSSLFPFLSLNILNNRTLIVAHILLLFFSILISCAWVISLADLGLNSFYRPAKGLKSSKNYIKKIAFHVDCNLNNKYGSKGALSKSSFVSLCVVTACSDCWPTVCHNYDIRGFSVSKSKFWDSTLKHTAPTPKYFPIHLRAIHSRFRNL
jgi:hypothetical protein